jgi:hypothetical protein
VKGVGEPCAGEPHARFDGRGLETERDSVTAPVPDPTNLPRSLDYNPATFNRLARALYTKDVPAPAEVPLHPRHLRYRDAVIKELGAVEVEDSDLPEGSD